MSVVLLDDVTRRLGYPRGHLARHASEHGLVLTRDWAGRPAVDEDQAAALVDQVTGQRDAARRAKQAAAHGHAAQQAAAEQRLERRARAAFDAGVEQFGDASVAQALFYAAGDPRLSDADLVRQLGEAAERWQAGFRTLRPEPQRGDEDLAAVADRVTVRHHVRRGIQVRREFDEALRRRREREGGR